MSARDPYDSPAGPGVVGVLLAAIGRGGGMRRGVVVLTRDEAEFLRRTGFSTAATGAWTVTPLPPRYLVGRYPEFAPLDPAWEPPPAPVEASCETAVPRASVRPHAPAASPWAWLVRALTADQRRVLASLATDFAPRVKKRTLQQRLRRMPGTSFNRALNDLTGKGVITREGGWVVLKSDARTVLLDAGIGVRLARGGRAMADGRERQRSRGKARARQPRLVWYRDRHGRLVAMRARGKNGRRPVPPVGTSAWGRSQLARRGGLAVQRLYRKFGVHPTAAATRARLAKQRRQRQAAAVQRSPVVTGSGSLQHVDASAPWSRAGTTAEQLSAAWASLEPIGRRERLAEKRRRR